jgi:hypothetical protein
VLFGLVLATLFTSCLGLACLILSSFVLVFRGYFFSYLGVVLLSVGLVLSSLSAVFTWCCLVITSGVLSCFVCVFSRTCFLEVSACLHY